jgi:hypothetical protein
VELHVHVSRKLQYVFKYKQDQKIKVTGTTGQKATQMMHLTRADPPSKLKAGQFIYYGLPRVVLKEGSPSPKTNKDKIALKTRVELHVHVSRKLQYFFKYKQDLKISYQIVWAFYGLLYINMLSNNSVFLLD